MYTAQGTIDKSHLLAEYLPVVRQVAKHLKGRLPPNVELDDLVQAGRLGLIEAWERFQQDTTASFETFARHRIRGAMLDELRAMDWVPRRVRQTAKDVEHAIAAASQALGRPPSDSEVAAQMKLSLSQYHETLVDIQGCQLVYAEDLLGEHGGEAADLERDTGGRDPVERDPMAVLLSGEFRGRLVDAIAGLPPREAQVLSLYYDDEASFREIGEILGVTPARAGQLHNQAIARLRSALKELL